MSSSLAVIPGHGRRRDFPRTDIGNAERLVARFGEDLHYLPAWKKWLVWDGKRWAVDETKRVESMAKEVVRQLYDEARAAKDADDKKALASWAVRSEADGAIRAMLNRTMAEDGVSITPAMLDADPWKITVDNGVLDLRTGNLGPHDRALLSTKVAPAPYDPDATCPRFEAYLDRVMGGKRELVEFLQRAVGYSLTGDCGEQVLFFLFGAGANGKSVFLEVLRALLAEYASQADFTTFLERKHNDGPRHDIARLFGARVVTSSEVGEGKRLNESLVKSITGQDTVAARHLYAETFEFRPTFKLWLAANHKPVIRGTDAAIWRRIRLIPFTVQIPAAERDPTLAQTLIREELPGILAWAVAGCQQWLEAGLRAPEEVMMATDAYRTESDTLGAFLEEWCELRPGERTQASDLFRAYTAWADEGNEYKLSQTAFGRQLEERGITSIRSNGVWRVGIRLTKSLTAIGAPRHRPDQGELYDR